MCMQPLRKYTHISDVNSKRNNFMCVAMGESVVKFMLMLHSGRVLNIALSEKCVDLFFFCLLYLSFFPHLFFLKYNIYGLTFQIIIRLIRIFDLGIVIFII